MNQVGGIEILRQNVFKRKKTELNQAKGGTKLNGMGQGTYSLVLYDQNDPKIIKFR